MPLFEGDPVTQDARYKQYYDQQKQEKEKQQTLSKDVTDRVKQIYKDAPYIPASVILTMAKSGTSPETVEAIKKTAAKQTASQLDPQKPKKKGWFQEVIYDNVKAASRWSFAGLSFIPDVIQNTASQVFNDPSPGNIDGWFKSTQLGTLMSNTQEAGEGFFLGETAMEKQAERARRFRGEINGHAWTVGRGAAELAFTPGSKPFAILSGFVDAAVQFADPTIVGGKVLAAQKTARATLPGIGALDEIESARKLAKGLAGLQTSESAAFEASKFGKWVISDRRSKRLIRRIVEVASDTAKSVEEKTLFMLENIDGLDPAFARAFAEADDEAKVLGLLGTASARLATNPADVVLPTDIRNIKLATGFDWTRSLDDSAKERVAMYRTFRNKWLQSMPKGSVVINGNGQDKKQAVISYARYLRGAGIGDETPEFKTAMQKVVEAYSSTDPSTARASAKEAYDLVLETVFTTLGQKSPGATQFAKEAIAAARSAKARVFNINELGNADDAGTLQMLRTLLPSNVFDDVDPTIIDRIVVNGPGALIELADDVEVLPDFRRVRALAGNPWLTRSATGKKRGAAVVAEFVQQDIWKPLTLATGGYVMRNMIDAQTRIAMSGMSGMFTHPYDFFLWTFRKKGTFDITGEDFGGIIAKNWNKEQDEFWQGLTFDIHKNLVDPWEAEQNLLRNGNFSIVDRGDNAVAHITGYVDNLALINSDPILGQIAQLGLENLTQPQRTQRIVDWLGQPENTELLGQLRNYFAEGVKYTDPTTGKTGRIRIDPDDLDDAINVWVDRLSEFKVSSVIKTNEDIRVVAAYNKVPLLTETSPGVFVATGPVNVNVNNITPADIISGNGGVGSIVRIPGGEEGVILRQVSTPSGTNPFTGLPGTTDEFVIQPVHAGPAFTGDGLGSQNLRNLLDTLGSEDKLAPKVKIAQRGKGDQSIAGQEFLNAKNKAVDFFFVSLYGKATQFLEKSPVFRQAYYKTVFENADLLDPFEAGQLITRAQIEAQKVGMKLEKYMGGKDVLKKLQDVANSSSNAIGTVEQLDDYAKAIALNETKNLLYNATERSNIEDVMRIMVPFGSAWKEVLGTYAKNVIEDPTRIRRAQLIFDAARKFDPDNDGEGFFYKDATTGEYSFNFPLSGQLTKLLTGQETPLQAPVKRLSIGLGVIPSIGPMAQIAYSKIAADTPSLDFVSSILIPYGKKESFQIKPMWIQRLEEVWDGDTQNLQTVYGNTYIETMRALAASGEYDLSDSNEQQQLFADAKSKARIIAGLRALGQFFGPTSPSPEFKIDTIAGDFYGTQLVKEFHKLQNNNYDTAVSEFLRIYGNDALLYISNKTESVAGGLEATDDFGDWERGEGKGLIDQYPDVAGFMAPGGDNFSFEVRSRQLSKGLRRRLTDREIVELAQYRAASAQYRALRDKLPPRPTDDQKRWLRQWRVKLNKEYPGFPVVAEFNPGEFPKKLEQLERLVQDDRLADNDVADASRQYLAARTAAVQRYVQAGGSAGGFSTAISAAPLRDWLAGVGKALKQEVPEFSRIYERLLSSEVEE